MSELIQKRDNRTTIRWKLLTGASALALTAYISSVSLAKAEDASQPQIWIELGGQFERQTGQGDMPVPPFVGAYPGSLAFTPISPGKLEQVPLYSEGLEGSISFEPRDSGWVFSAGIRYGRAGRHKNSHQGQEKTATENYTHYPRYYYSQFGKTVWELPKTGTVSRFIYENEGIQISQSQRHMVLDFSAGKDVGLGMFGHGGSSTLSVGVRFAQFVSNSSSVIHARPDAIFSDPCNAHWAAYFAPIFPSHDFKFCFPKSAEFHTFAAEFHSQRKFQGVGPSIAWNASVPIVGDIKDEALTIDWGVNAAILFGRQRAKGGHQTHGSYYGNDGLATPTSYTHVAPPFDRSRRVTIPNLGGMLGMSLKFQNAKVSIGYRGDFFFGAMDTGITGFYGPFASISIGLGD